MIKFLFIAGEIENQKYIDEMRKINLQERNIKYKKTALILKLT
jgi:hypothetical protein